jgi:hypothetical protein
MIRKPVKASIGKSPLDGLKNLPKMSGPLGAKPGAKASGLGMVPIGPKPGTKLTGINPNAKPLPSTNTTTAADMARKGNAKPFSSVASKLGGIGASLGKKMGMKAGGKVSSASSRGDGCAVKGKTKGRMV